MEKDKVMNSVQQILDESAKLVETAHDIGLINTKIAASIVEQDMRGLKELFDLDPANTFELEKLKATTEMNAINLEYQIQCVSDKFNERYTLRKTADSLFADVHDTFIKISRAHEPEEHSTEVANWAAYCSFALRLSMRAKHVVFYTDKDDEDMIKTIMCALQDFRESEEKICEPA